MPFKMHTLIKCGLHLLAHILAALELNAQAHDSGSGQIGPGRVTERQVFSSVDRIWALGTLFLCSAPGPFTCAPALFPRLSAFDQYLCFSP